MTKKAFVELVKRAKSARDKANEIANIMGRPTSTGIAAGAGLGAILAATGAVARSDEDPRNVSVLSNPLLLGSLGAAGGYMAGNAFDRAPAKRSDKDLSWTALAGLLGGTGILGTHLAKEDAAEGLDALEKDFRNASRKVPFTWNDEGGKEWHPGKEWRGDDKLHNIKPRGRGRDALSKEIQEFNKSREAYQEGLLRAGRVKDAIREVGYASSTGKLARIWDFLRLNPKSPYRWLTALNPLKGGKLINQIGGFATKSPWAAGAAGLALLAGGGKAIYDKVHD